MVRQTTQRNREQIATQHNATQQQIATQQLCKEKSPWKKLVKKRSTFGLLREENQLHFIVSF